MEKILFFGRKSYMALQLLYAQRVKMGKNQGNKTTLSG